MRSFLGYSPTAMVGYGAVENPSEAIARNSINLARAQEAGMQAAAPWQMAGNLGMSLSQILMGAGMPSGASKGLHTAVGNIGSVAQGLGQASNLFAMGGQPNQMGVAEGGELAEYQDGSMGQIEGPTHEQGGVPMDMSQIANIYSDRVKIDGLSIADRNKKRIKRNANLRDILERDPYNTLVLKSWERGEKNHQAMRERELNIQKEISKLIR